MGHFRCQDLTLFSADVSVTKDSRRQMIWQFSKIVNEVSWRKHCYKADSSPTNRRTAFDYTAFGYTALLLKADFEEGLCLCEPGSVRETKKNKKNKHLNHRCVSSSMIVIILKRY